MDCAALHLLVDVAVSGRGPCADIGGLGLVGEEVLAALRQELLRPGVGGPGVAEPDGKAGSRDGVAVSLRVALHAKGGDSPSTRDPWT